MIATPSPLGTAGLNADERRTFAHIFRLLATAGDTPQLLRTMTSLLQKWAGCDAVGIRLKDGDDYPYIETRGFSESFVRAESRLCQYEADGQTLRRDGQGNPSLECMCGNVIQGRIDPQQPFFTTRGSFWTNSTSRLLGETSEADRKARTRNRCNGEGYESVALIPLGTSEQNVGLMQFNDRRPDRFTPDVIALLELMADSVAVVLENRRMEQEKHQLEAQLQQAQKMEAIGTLAGGIAHDFNNILFPIIGFAEMLQEQIPAESAYQEAVHEILTAANRARELVHQILAFSRQAEHERKPLHIQPILKEVLKLVRAILPATITIQSKIAGECGHVLGDASRIHQVLMNLITNAYHAMQARGGTLTIVLEEKVLSGSQALQAALPEGGYAHIQVADTGCGMNSEVLARIFEPYFSTKGKDKGTGLGLSVALGIVKGMAGAILVNSAPEQGTCFDVYLPVIEAHAEIKAAPAGPLPRGSERILLVDDEEAIVRMLVARLARLGYQVTPYTDSRKALEAFSINPQGVDLVITDLTMPHLTGDELVSRMRAMRPQLPVIMCTGFSESITAEQAGDLGIGAFIMKPVLAADLAHAIRRVLDHVKVGQ